MFHDGMISFGIVRYSKEYSPDTPTTCTLTAGGAAPATATITVTGWPTAALTAGPAAILSGQSATL